MSDPNHLITKAMAVLEDAHVVADAIKAEAERYARDRRLEADLLISKARRVLHAAESKAEAIVASARAGAPGPVDVAGPEQVIDLDALADPADPGDSGDAADPAEPAASSLDRILDAAIARAVTRALPDHAAK